MSEETGTDHKEDNEPRTMRDRTAPERRRAMLALPHIAPLVAYADGLRRDGVEAPEFDPLDGGVEAEILFLFEKPGRMTAEDGGRAGSGFISRDNDDPTAEAIFRFMREAGISRESTVIWNVIPCWNGTRKVTAKEIRDGTESLRALIELLPKLAAVVMVGKAAARARPCLEAFDLKLFESWHPSPINRAVARAKWDAIPSEWAKVLVCVRGGR
jgi:uracil-DNA glycosylase